MPRRVSWRQLPQEFAPQSSLGGQSGLLVVELPQSLVAAVEGPGGKGLELRGDGLFRSRLLLSEGKVLPVRFDLFLQLGARRACRLWRWVGRRRRGGGGGGRRVGSLLLFKLLLSGGVQRWLPARAWRGAGRTLGRKKGPGLDTRDASWPPP